MSADNGGYTRAQSGHGLIAETCQSEPDCIEIHDR
jgi:hypothetical protein